MTVVRADPHPRGLCTWGIPGRSAHNAAHRWSLRTFEALTFCFWERAPACFSRRMFVATDQDILRSDDGGSHFMEVNEGLLDR